MTLGSGKKMKNKYLSSLIRAIVIILLFVIILAFFNADEGWLGFWGGIIGSAIGILGAFLVLKEQVNYDRDALQKQIDEEKELSRMQQIDNTFFNLLSMHNEQINSLKENNKFSLIYQEINRELKVEMKNSCSIYLRNEPNIKTELNNIKKQCEEYIKEHEAKIPKKYEEQYQDYWIKRHRSLTFNWEKNQVLENMYHAIGAILTIEDIISTEIEANAQNIFANLDKLDSYMRHLKFTKSEMWITLYAQIFEYKTDNFTLIDKESRKIIIEQVLNDHYSELGSYFRLFHRIIKYINDKFEENGETEKNSYLGFLRATLNEEELLVIFYNSAYTKRGEGLLRELNKTTFFGTKEDIENNQHFNIDKLFWKHDDIKFMLNSENKMNQ